MWTSLPFSASQIIYSLFINGETHEFNVTVPGDEGGRIQVISGIPESM